LISGTKFFGSITLPFKAHCIVSKMESNFKCVILTFKEEMSTLSNKTSNCGRIDCQRAAKAWEFDRHNRTVFKKEYVH